MSNRTGRFAIIEQLLADDIHCMFGNPGTVEEGFLDAIGHYPDFEYIAALQETIAVACADGYARATRKPTVVQLHSGVGLGNGIGMLYQAMRGHAPLVVLVGDAGTQYDAMDAQMAADLIGMGQPVTKWAARVTHPSSVLRMLRRAIKIAATPPAGPVLLVLPMDVLDAENDEDIVPTVLPETRVMPPQERIDEAAAMLAGASRPMIIMGDGVVFSGATGELVTLAETLGAEVWGADCSEVNMPQSHPLFQGLLGHMFGSESSRITTQADAVLICGTYVFPEVFPALSGVFAPHARVIHIDLNLYEIAKNFPVHLGLLGDPKVSLAKLTESLRTDMTSEQKKAAAMRVEEISAAEKERREELRLTDTSVRDAVPLHMSRFAEELASFIPEDAIVFDEALTNSPALCRSLLPSIPGNYFQTRGGSLGVGIPGAIGLKIAHPEKTVVGITGDGGSLYTIQALWTAVHHNIDAKFVICNNHSYLILKLNLLQYWRERKLPVGDYPESFDIQNPNINYAQFASAMGAHGERVETPEQIAPAIKRALAHQGPYLIDLVLTNEVAESQIGTKCGQ
jgi:thiamine pyrophosphate-dependent acetolactate synthase large subunit-like protein